MKRILIVEDDYFIRDIYTRMFISAGFSIDSAADGDEGWTKAQAGGHDLILLDIMLPKMTGIDVLKKIRDPASSTKTLPVLLITNLGQEEIIKEAFAIGADGYLIKSQLKPQDVVAEVRTFFAQQAASAASETPVIPQSNAPEKVAVVEPPSSPS